ncbi:MAG: sugar ABC transporter permease [Pelomonas sp.]|nr:sugar ABC transporter permease [Roseateles sp.]
MSPSRLTARLRRLVPWAALLPLALTVLVAYLGGALWTLRISVSSSRTFPASDFVGLAQYARLFDNERWQLALHNLGVYGALFIVASMAIGFLLAVFVDQKVRGEGLLRTAFLYPYAMSFVATGLIWQWLLNPDSGLQAAVQQLGWQGFVFDWIVDQDRVIYTVVIASVWQAAGLVMALMLAGLRGVDAEIWQAARLDGIPAWRVYASIVLPTLGPTLATAFVVLATMVVKAYDVVVSMTQGGPGTASDLPAKFIMDLLFGRANIALASAGAMVLLATVLALVAPLLYARGHAARRAQRAGRGGR